MVLFIQNKHQLTSVKLAKASTSLILLLRQPIGFHVKKNPHWAGLFPETFGLFADNAHELTIVFTFHFKLNFTVS